MTKGTVLFVGVTSVYFYVRSQNLSLAETQTCAFSAWIFGHIALAYVSRSDKESIFSMGVFSNRIINLWALTAIGALMLGIYTPFLNERFNLVPIDITRLVFIALAMLVIVGLLEIKKIAGTHPSVRSNL